MMSPLKLSVIVCGAAAGLAVAPYVVKQILPPVSTSEITATDEPVDVSTDSVVKLDLPVAGSNEAVKSKPALELAPAVREETPSRPELHLAAPALPSPAMKSEELSLPSLSSPEVASAVPTPSMTPTPAPTPVPTPEIPYSADVEVAQKLMRDMGIDTGKIDGKLGPNTQAAVKKFQREQGLAESGKVDSSLLKRMEKVVAEKAAADAKAAESEIKVTDADDPDTVIVRKSRNDDAAEAKVKVTEAVAKPKVDPGPVPTLKNMKDVRKLQAQLKQAGTYEAEVDGKWGDLTRAAMREFQKKNDLEVTGRPNRETWVAMHMDDDNQIDDSSERDVTTTIASADEMEISSVDSEISSAEAEEDHIVSLNGDGVSDPGGTEPIPTPAAVSSFDDVDTEDTGSREVADDDSTPRVNVSAPDRGNDDLETDEADEAPSDLAVAENDEDAELEKLKRELESRKAQITSVSNDDTYEVEKYAPQTLKAVNNMVNDFKIESVSNNPSEARERLAEIDAELEKAKQESMKKKAGLLVEGVTEAYDELKEHFPERIKSLSLKNSKEKEQREELTELVAKVDLGYEAMRADYKDGKYDPIFKNAVQFRATIIEISKTVAEAYVAARLEEKSIKSKLKDSTLEEIEELQKDSDHMKAAEVLDKASGSKSSKKS